MAGISDALRFSQTIRPGTRVKRISTGQVGVLLSETYRGPWVGFQHAWRVLFDADYCCRVRSFDLTQDMMAPFVVPKKPRTGARRRKK